MRWHSPVIVFSLVWNGHALQIAWIIPTVKLHVLMAWLSAWFAVVNLVWRIASPCISFVCICTMKVIGFHQLHQSCTSFISFTTHLSLHFHVMSLYFWKAVLFLHADKTHFAILVCKCLQREDCIKKSAFCSLTLASSLNSCFPAFFQEHHLQRAISAQQVYGEKRDNMVIPVPEAECNITHYESLYPGEFKMPKQLIHIQRE